MNTSPSITRRSPQRSLRRGFPLAAAVLAMLAMLAFLIADRVEPGVLPVVRYLALLPVGLASYRRGGLIPGFLYTAFFGSAFLWQAAWAPGEGSLGSALSATAVLLAYALVLHSVAVSFGSREVVANMAQERGAMLERSTDINQLVHFIREQARRDNGAESAALLLYNTWESHWELIGSEATTAIQLPAADHPLPLPAWLAVHAPREVIRDLPADVRFLHSGSICSLLTRPLRDREGALLGVLVLAHSRPGRFSPADLEQLDRLAQSAETALALAGAYARADKAFDRVAGHLVAIERTARDLNATLDAREIARLTLRCAMLLTGGQRAAVRVDAPGLEAVHLAAGSDGEAADWEGVNTPIRLGDRALGSITIETNRGGAAAQDRQALATLAEHAAGALESARLFAAVRDEREKSEQIIRNMTDGLLTLDGARRITSANPAAEQLLGQAGPALLNRRLCDVLLCDSQECAEDCSVLDALSRGEPVPEGWWRPRSPGETGAILHLDAAPLPAPEGGAVVLLRDVTRQEELARFQRELVATFSHELRAPLANIDAAVQLAQALDPDAATAEQRQFFKLVQAQTRRLAGLAERTLDVARLDDGKWRLEPRPLAPAKIAEDALARWQRAAAGREFLLEAGETPWALADEIAVTTVLDNLIDNAVKYTPPDGRILVSVRAEPPGNLTIAVEDQGAGVEPGKAEALFERFRRGDGDESRRVDGYGLGLYVSRRLVEAMGGQIWAEPGPEGGSRFAFTLPLMPEDTHEDPDR